MNVLLVNPPLVGGSEVQPPLALCSLAHFARDSGIHAEILDLSLELSERQEFTFEAASESFLSTIRTSRPDVVAVTSMYNNSLIADRLIGLAKRQLRDVVTVAGGSHFGAMGALALEGNPDLDFVIEGEGELAFTQLLLSLAEGSPLTHLPNLVYRNNGAIAANPHGPLMDLAECPSIWPQAGAYVDLERYVRTVDPRAERRAMYIEAGRGCPFHCTFCAPAQFWQRKYRVKRPEVVVDEIEFFADVLGYNYFQLVHDLLFASKDYVSVLCDRMIERSLAIEWMANARMDLPFDDLVEKLVASGCRKLFFGIESGVDRLQRSVRKDLDLDAVPLKVAGLWTQGISPTCSFVIGFPDERPQEISRTIRYGTRLRLLGSDTVQYHRLRLFPPAPIADTCELLPFDRHTFALEFPFEQFSDDDIAEVGARAEFYAGYFPPVNRFVPGHVLTQAEQFFQQAVTLAPLTLALVCELHEDALVDRFSAWVDNGADLRRASGTEADSQLQQLWPAISSGLQWLLDKGLADAPQLEPYRGLFEIETAKVELQVERERSGEAGRLFRCGRVIEIGFDLPAAIGCLTRGDGLPEGPTIRQAAIMQWDPNGSLALLVAN